MNHAIKAVIVDDEPACVANLAYYLATYCPEIEVLAKGYSLTDAQQLIQTQQFDLAFFDIQLFDRNIFELMDGHNFPFDVVLVTAYDAYAIRAIRSEVFDYLLKPLSRAEITACYNRLLERRSGTSTGLSIIAAPMKEPADLKMVLKSGEQVYVIRHSDIIYLRANGAYTEVIFMYASQRKSITIGKSINTMAQTCQASVFLRVHKSYVVNMRYIRSVVKNDCLQLVMVNNDVVPVAKRRCSEFLQSYRPSAV